MDDQPILCDCGEPAERRESHRSATGICGRCAEMERRAYASARSRMAERDRRPYRGDGGYAPSPAVWPQLISTEVNTKVGRIVRLLNGRSA